MIGSSSLLAIGQVCGWAGTRYRDSKWRHQCARQQRSHPGYVSFTFLRWVLVLNRHGPTAQFAHTHTQTQHVVCVCVNGAVLRRHVVMTVTTLRPLSAVCFSAVRL